MARAFIPLLTCLAVVLLSAAGTASEGIDGEVLRVDLKKQCLWLDWDNGTEKTVGWTAKSKFSVLETGKPAKPADLRKGSYVRMQGTHKDGTYWAEEIVIWEAASKPPGKEVADMFQRPSASAVRRARCPTRNGRLHSRWPAHPASERTRLRPEAAAV